MSGRGGVALCLALLVSSAPAGAARPFACPDCPAMAIVPAGRFVMGAEGGEPGRPEGPAREIAIADAFALAVTETTVAEFARFVEATGHEPSSVCRVWTGEAWATLAGYDWRRPGPGLEARDDEPVVCVSWRDARAYAAWLADRTGVAFRLPSEAEWEYAATAGFEGQAFWSEAPQAACSHANVYDRRAAGTYDFSWPPAPCDDGHAALAPVGRYAPNAFGLHDLYGNVWEWLADCYVAPYPPEPVDGSAVEVEGACERRTVRGGSWITRLSRHRPSFRGRDPETFAATYFGFRVAADLPDDRLEARAPARWPHGGLRR